MDDFKLISKTEDQLQKQMQVVRTSSDDMDMAFGLDKRAKTLLNRGKLVHLQNLTFDFNTHTRARTEKNMQVTWN